MQESIILICSDISRLSTGTIFNAMTYQVVQGLWFLLSSMHSFDLNTRTVKKLPEQLIVARQ